MLMFLIFLKKILEIKLEQFSLLSKKTLIFLQIFEMARNKPLMSNHFPSQCRRKRGVFFSISSQLLFLASCTGIR